jgi:hypothetical protein
MGSHPTLDHHQPATGTRQFDPDDRRHSHAVAHPATEHPQVRTWPDDNPSRAHEQDHRDGIYDHPHPTSQRNTEEAFDRLNPDYGVPADPHNPHGHQALHDREAALSLGTRVAVAASRENDRDPVMWLAGQDYRAADATRHARLELVRSRRGPERVGPER